MGGFGPPSYKEEPLRPKYYRCEKCRTLLTDRMIASGECAGHKIGYAEKGTLWEWVKIKLGLIR